MKIKCPYCEIQVDNSAELCGHLIEHGEYFCIESLARLIFKIHEKIESLDRGLFKKAEEDIGRDGYVSSETASREFAIKELKSLLENDKK